MSQLIRKIYYILKYLNGKSLNDISFSQFLATKKFLKKIFLLEVFI